MLIKSLITEFSVFAENYLDTQPHFNRKFTEYQYIENIINVLRSATYWRRYYGPINGRVLNNKHNFYVKSGLYNAFYKFILEKYYTKNKNSKWKYLSIDSTFIQNKFGVNKIGRNKFYKNKRGIKISSIVDSKGIPLSTFIDKGSINDAKLFQPTFMNILIKTNASKYINSNKHKQYFLADKGYDSKQIRTILKTNSYEPIIAQNRRNIKDPNKIKKFSLLKKKIYKKRIIVENYFAWITANPKLMRMYEKTIESYYGLVELANILLVSKRIAA